MLWLVQLNLYQHLYLWIQFFFVCLFYNSILYVCFLFGPFLIKVIAKNILHHALAYLHAVGDLQ